MPKPESGTIGHLLEFNARHFPDSIALACDGVERTNREWRDRGCKLASALQKAGISRQDRISILSRNCLEIMDVYAAGWLSGVIVATVNFRLAGPEIVFIVNDSLPRVLIFEAIYLPLIDTIRSQFKGIDRFVCIGDGAPWAEEFEGFLEAGDADGLSYVARGDDIANLIYTSGTTGKPRGCIHGQRELLLLAQSLALVQRSTIAERFLAVMPLFHIGALATALAHIVRLGTVHIGREFEANTVLATIEKERINIILLAPTMVLMLLDAQKISQVNVTSLNQIIYSASPIPSTTLRRGIERFGPIFVQWYGQTEVISTYLPTELHLVDGTEEDSRRLLSAGIPFPNTSVRIVDDADNECSCGQTGEIVSATPAMARGYWGNSAATIDTFRDGWCHTGDIGRIDPRGFLYIVDRKKDVIISGGENVYSREVEEALLLHPAVAEAAVIGRPDPVWGEAVCAVVRLSTGVTAGEAELIEHVKGQIASYKKPKTILFETELPKLITGKINKLTLREKLIAHARKE